MATSVLMKPPYNISFPDISQYQNYNQYSQYTPINWQVVAQTKSVKGVMVKCSEGTWTGYPDTVALDQMRGAQSVGLVAVPYHFWSYGIDAAAQAANFKRVWSQLAVKPQQWMVDIEDMRLAESRPPGYAIPTAEYPVWIPKARAIAGSVKLTLDAIAQSIGKPPIWYGGAWYQDWWTWLCTIDGVDMSWMRKYPVHCASYTSPYMYLMSGFVADNVYFWQWTSTPPDAYQIPGFPWPARLDMNWWLKSDAEFYEFFGEAVPPVVPPEEETPSMPKIYNQAVPYIERARVALVEPHQKVVGYWGDLGVDAVILPMGGMSYDPVNGRCVCAPEATFAWRCAVANMDVLVFGQFRLDAGAWLKGQLTAPDAEAPIKDNLITKSLIDSWHDGAWTWDKVLTNQGKWRRIDALVLDMTSVDGWPTGTLVSDNWQTRILKVVTDHIRMLQGTGALPKVPVILYSGPWFMQLYPDGELMNFLTQRADWLYLALGEWVLGSTATFETLDDIFLHSPSDDFQFSWVPPDGYGQRILMFNHTGQHQKVKTITDAEGAPSTVTLSYWCDTTAAMMELLGYDAPDDDWPDDDDDTPEPPSGDVENRLLDLEDKMGIIIRCLRDLLDNLD